MVTSDLGVALRVLTEWYGDWDPGRRPPTDLCHWEKHLRAVTNPDWQVLYGWDAEGGLPEEDFRIAIVERAAPLVLSLMSAEALRDSLAPDNTDQEREPQVNYPIRLTSYLALLARIGPRDRILPTMQELWRISVGQDWEETTANDIERVSADTGIRLSDR